MNASRLVPTPVVMQAYSLRVLSSAHIVCFGRSPVCLHPGVSSGRDTIIGILLDMSIADPHVVCCVGAVYLGMLRVDCLTQWSSNQAWAPCARDNTLDGLHNLDVST